MQSYDKLSKDGTKDVHCSRKCKAYSMIILLIVCLIVMLIVISFGNYKFGSNKASLYLINHHDCNDLDYVYKPNKNRYGCCQFKDYLNKTYTISMSTNIKRDESGSNCPTYNILIYNYIDYIETYPKYFNTDRDINENCIINNITLPLEKGHCPSTYTIKLAYENYYISPYSDYICLGIIVSLFLCFISLC
tara:strand:- start:511 stop:1083 length:573 start_codon:yes stop_codon:yes gene_type:complete